MTTTRKIPTAHRVSRLQHQINVHVSNDQHTSGVLNIAHECFLESRLNDIGRICCAVFRLGCVRAVVQHDGIPLAALVLYARQLRDDAGETHGSRAG